MRQCEKIGTEWLEGGERQRSLINWSFPGPEFVKFYGCSKINGKFISLNNNNDNHNKKHENENETSAVAATISYGVSFTDVLKSLQQQRQQQQQQQQ